MPTVSETPKFFSDSRMGRLLSPPEQQELQNSNEKIIFTLFKRFTVPQTSSANRFQQASNLFQLATKLAQKNVEGILTGPTATTTSAPTKAKEEPEFRELITNSMGLHALKDAESFQSLFQTLRRKSAGRAHLKQILTTFEPSGMIKRESGGTKLPAVDTLPFARAAFISMVRSNS